MTKVKNFFIKIWEFLKKFHWYGWVGVGVLIGYQSLCYYLGYAISEASGMTANAISPKIDAIDNCFPVVPFFVLIYWFTFVFWGLAILATALTNKSNFINMAMASIIASSIGLIILASFPTYIDRMKEGAIDIVNQPGFFNWWLKQTYIMDGGLERSWKLLPSYHCMTSLALALGTFRRKDSPLWWRIFAFILVILICLSTLFTKQHYFLDVITGLSIAAISFTIIKLINPGKRILDKYNHKSKKA